MNEELTKVVEWFKELLGVDSIKLAFGSDFSDDCLSYKGVLWLNKYLDRDTLYFDTSTNTLTTHSPYGSVWRMHSNILQLKVRRDKFRWVFDYIGRGNKNIMSNLIPCVVTVINHKNVMIKHKVVNKDILW